jgi:hypothetical protein
MDEEERRYAQFGVPVIDLQRMAVIAASGTQERRKSFRRQPQLCLPGSTGAIRYDRSSRIRLWLAEELRVRGDVVKKTSRSVRLS